MKTLDRVGTIGRDLCSYLIGSFPIALAGLTQNISRWVQFWSYFSNKLLLRLSETLSGIWFRNKALERGRVIELPKWLADDMIAAGRAELMTK